MKKFFSAILAAAAVLSLVSCGKEESQYPVDGDMSSGMKDLKLSGENPAVDLSSSDMYKIEEGNQEDYDEIVSEEYAAERVGEYQDIPYTDFTGSEWFEMYFEDFRDPDNPLQLSTGAFDDAVAVSPVKSAYFNGSEYVGAMNGWEFPIAHGNQCIGVITMNGEIDDNGIPIGSSSESYAQELNKALENGKIAIFEVGNCHNLFAIAEDGTVYNLIGEAAYKGNLTFEEVDKGYNVISEDNFSTAVYPFV